MTSNLKKYEALTSPRIVWATKDFATYGINEPNIYVSKNVSSEIGTDLRLMEHRSFELYGSIQDLRTFFNESDQKSVQEPLDMHLLQKLQVLQHVNPTIKALLNLKGIGSKTKKILREFLRSVYILNDIIEFSLLH